LIETQLKLGLPRVHHDMVTFRQKVESLNLGVEKFLDGHSLRTDIDQTPRQLF